MNRLKKILNHCASLILDMFMNRVKCSLRDRSTLYIIFITQSLVKSTLNEELIPFCIFIIRTSLIIQVFKNKTFSF